MVPLSKNLNTNNTLIIFVLGLLVYAYLTSLNIHGQKSYIYMNERDFNLANLAKFSF